MFWYAVLDKKRGNRVFRTPKKSDNSFEVKKVALPLLYYSYCFQAKAFSTRAGN